MKKIKVAICDDVADVYDGYKMFINIEDDMNCNETAYTSQQCIEMVKRSKPDILLLDIQMEDEKSGIEIIPEIKKISPKTVVIMLTSFNDSKYIFLSVLSGADGYVIKDSDGKKMLGEVRKIYKKAVAKENDSNVDIIAAMKTETKSLYEFQKSTLYIIDRMVKLSYTEYEILKDIYNGISYKKIAEDRFVEECTVRTNASRIIKKLEQNQCVSS